MPSSYLVRVQNNPLTNGPEYYFSSSPGERVHIVEEIFRSGLPGPHLAAKSFLCAVWHTWTLRTTGRDARKVEEWQNRTKSFLRACNQLAQNHVTPLFDRVGSLLDVRLGHVRVLVLWMCEAYDSFCRIKWKTPSMCWKCAIPLLKNTSGKGRPIRCRNGWRRRQYHTRLMSSLTSVAA